MLDQEIGECTLFSSLVPKITPGCWRGMLSVIVSEDGDIIDCVDIYKQPAFDHPSLKNHTIQLRPSIYNGESMSSSKPLEQLWHKSGSCPQGTIPIQRTQKRHLLGAIYFDVSQLESCKASKDYRNYGGAGVINVWNIHVEPSEFSKASIFVGRRDNFDLIDAGWMDKATSNWWLVVNNESVGYWPSSLFQSMADHADYVQWGGQVFNMAPGGSHTSTQMGSGHFPNEGFGKAAFFDKCVFFNTDNIVGTTPYKAKTKSEDGDIFDCVDIYKQPALDHPLLKNHTIQMRPSFCNKEKESTSKPLEQLWHKSGSCPGGTIPIRRTRRRDLLGAISSQGFGVKASSSEFEVSKSLFGDDVTRLFGYWESENGGCANMLCSGFVQSTSKLPLGVAATPSTYGGEQRAMSVKIYWDSASPGNWWLSINDEPVGYWPGALFKSMNGKAQYIQWGGQVHRPTPGETHSSTQMGSGHWPKEGFGKAAFFDKCVYYPPINNGRWDPRTPYPHVPEITKSGCYDIADLSTVNGGQGFVFFYGGPGGPNCDA
ncbi:NEP-interacting protein 1 [Cinnamomum micranthum f. kanehirae]|uniref:NEP-interacting protein 1 n=1 Tax=Cinnamomum micranthum f. kanehirae TaxID=337451 RepID=A0A3S3M3E1_9MAGN|nr:NEP-interacting protein 1 [Cinnamomum micranthum f. kanehirae]